MAASKRASFTGFEPFKLTGVRVTDRKLGHGSYATVLELDYMGLKCAGKKIHEVLLEQGDASYTVHRFKEECHLLSQVRHPNIVQFLGVYFQHTDQVPILVMEYLPINLTSCIEQYGILPKEISYSILHDVALSLCYLHSQTPPIIHRDLSSNNVLLTPNMTAKISDLGVARILNLTPHSYMTQTPGTSTYMPPEVMVANPKYDTSVDEFSYGILMIHLFSGRWPEPQVGQIHTEQGRLIPVSEAKRRETFLQTIGNDHPLMELVHRCINNDPELRPHTSEIARKIGEISSQFPTSFANQLEMLRRIEAVEEENRILIEKGKTNDRVIEEKRINTTLSEMDHHQAGEQLTKARECLSAKKQALQASITWKLCTELPTGLSAGVNTVVNNKIYCGGRVAVDKDMHIVFCYDPIPNKWTTLPPLPIRYFGLGRVNGKLVAVGGLKKGEDSSNEVYIYDERSQKWKQTIPPMPTARCFPGVMSRQFALVVAGGYTSSASYSAAVEIFKPDTSQWYGTDPLPIACCNVSIVAIGNTCCVLGGYKHPSNLNQALYAMIDDLLRNAVPANQITHSSSRFTQSAWKTLPNAPTYRPAAAVLAGNLFAVGGKEMPEGGVDKGEVYMYSPSINSWLYISDLPAPRSNSTVAIWSSTQVMVIGGQGKDTRVNTVCVGTFTIS